MKRHFANSPDDSSMPNDSTETPNNPGGSAPSRAEAAPLSDDSLTAASANAEDRGADEPPAPARPFEDLTISELLALMRGSPASTFRRFRLAVRSAEARERSILVRPPVDDFIEVELASGSSARMALRDAPRLLLRSEFPRLAMYLLAFLLALMGSHIARGTADIPRHNGYSLQVASPYMWLGFLLWLIGDLSGHWAEIQATWRRSDRDTRIFRVVRVLPAIMLIGSIFRFAESLSAPAESAVDIAISALGLFTVGLAALLVINAFFRRYRRTRGSFYGNQSERSGQQSIISRAPALRPLRHQLSRRRVILLALASALSLVVWLNTSGNRIEPDIMLIWLASIVAWTFVFAPRRWNMFDWGASAIDRLRRLSLRGRGGTVIALVLIMALGASFRFDRLDTAPPELYSDMVVNLVDAYQIHRGENYPIFLGNNGGREPIHIYLQAFLSGLPGIQFDRTALILLNALESLLTLPVMCWFAVEAMGRKRRQEALTIGILATALLAVSYWHVTLSRQGLRIPLSPLFTALSALFFARALRHNRRGDYILAGILLSLGLYSYKSLRMLPVVYVISIGIALLIRRYSWRVRASYLLNLTILAFVAGIVFLPMLHFWVEEPNQFTWRATTRIFGDQPTTDAERIELLREGGATFLSNVRNALLMFHHTNDNTWVSAIPGQPALDPVTGAFFLLGAAAWLGLLARERDPVYWFVPVLFFVMVLLIALAIAFPIEVPSLQRASGAIPPAYLIAALPLARLCSQLKRALPRALGLVAAVGFAIVVIASAYQYNRDLYFGEFMDNYHRSAQNHAEAGQILKGFVDSDGAYGNAFIISWPHWWDHRAVSIEAGTMRWDNSIVGVERLPQYIQYGLLREDEYQLQAERDLLFFFNPGDGEAPTRLRQWFPQGRQLEIRQDPANKSFYIYRVPAMGEAGLQTFLAVNG